MVEDLNQNSHESPFAFMELLVESLVILKKMTPLTIKPLRNEIGFNLRELIKQIMDRLKTFFLKKKTI